VRNINPYMNTCTHTHPCIRTHIFMYRMQEAEEEDGVRNIHTYMNTRIHTHICIHKFMYNIHVNVSVCGLYSPYDPFSFTAGRRWRVPRGA